ncbi:MAG: Ku protein, partial [Solirubrobacteraceae bacterium]|nr:Ku protein [Solirubrobacteraceae bacterium]
AIRPLGDALAMSTMVFADEVLDSGRLDELADTEDVKATKRELDIAKQLIQSLEGEWEPEKYKDTYREDVLALIERKAAGEEIAEQPVLDEEEAPVPDLMSALRASLDAVKARDDDGGSAKKKPAAPKKKPAAKKKSAA